MAKLRREIKIGPRTFRIEYLKNSPEIGEENEGRLLYEQGRILVNTHDGDVRLPEDTLRETLGHEIGHAWLFFLGLDELARNEAIAQSIGGCIAELL